ncbi:hypothetical protein ADUPG1_007324 [Aduncisulcus paluster]|uniref:Uncharacterized protein n=1 Tax=Aduncisulcus paluster TaxID=2918883 RepID=A0ABQ5KPD8_9EUKA|nr:hypothetical protein ADUPG1_007324 [Aduncisulcus paluster]
MRKGQFELSSDKGRETFFRPVGIGQSPQVLPHKHDIEPLYSPFSLPPALSRANILKHSPRGLQESLPMDCRLKSKLVSRLFVPPSISPTKIPKIQSLLNNSSYYFSFPDPPPSETNSEFLAPLNSLFSKFYSDNLPFFYLISSKYILMFRISPPNYRVALSKQHTHVCVVAELDSADIKRFSSIDTGVSDADPIITSRIASSTHSPKTPGQPTHSNSFYRFSSSKSHQSSPEQLFPSISNGFIIRGKEAITRFVNDSLIPHSHLHTLYSPQQFLKSIPLVLTLSIEAAVQLSIDPPCGHPLLPHTVHSLVTTIASELNASRFGFGMFLHGNVDICFNNKDSFIHRVSSFTPLSAQLEQHKSRASGKRCILCDDEEDRRPLLIGSSRIRRKHRTQRKAKMKSASSSTSKYEDTTLHRSLNNSLSQPCFPDVIEEDHPSLSVFSYKVEPKTTDYSDCGGREDSNECEEEEVCSQPTDFSDFKRQSLIPSPPLLTCASENNLNHFFLSNPLVIERKKSMLCDSTSPCQEDTSDRMTDDSDHVSYAKPESHSFLSLDTEVSAPPGFNPKDSISAPVRPLSPTSALRNNISSCIISSCITSMSVSATSTGSPSAINVEIDSSGGTDGLGLHKGADHCPGMTKKTANSFPVDEFEEIIGDYTPGGDDYHASSQQHSTRVIDSNSEASGSESPDEESSEVEDHELSRRPSGRVNPGFLRHDFGDTYHDVCAEHGKEICSLLLSRNGDKLQGSSNQNSLCEGLSSTGNTRKKPHISVPSSTSSSVSSSSLSSTIILGDDLDDQHNEDVPDILSCFPAKEEEEEDPVSCDMNKKSPSSMGDDRKERIVEGDVFREICDSFKKTRKRRGSGEAMLLESDGLSSLFRTSASLPVSANSSRVVTPTPCSARYADGLPSPMLLSPHNSRETKRRASCRNCDVSSSRGFLCVSMCCITAVKYSADGWIID